MIGRVAAVWLSWLMVFSCVFIIVEIAEPVRGATTITVDDSGGADYLTIQEGIDAANDGDTVFVYSGTYYERVRVDKTIDLKGENRDTTIIDGESFGDVVRVSSDWVNVSGFNLRNSKYDSSAVELYQVKNCHIFDNNITQNIRRGISIDSFGNHVIENNLIFNNSNGIYIFNSYENLIENNIISKNRYGIYLWDTERCQIRDNIMENSGIFFDSSSFSDWTTHEIDTSNTVNGNPLFYVTNQDGGTVPPNMGQVILANCTNMTIEDQNLHNTSVGIQLGYSSKIRIGNNYIKDVAGGIYLERSDGNNITHNNISSYYTDPILLRYSDGNKIISNNVTYSEGQIHLYNSNYNLILKNSISESKWGIDLHYSDRNDISNNTFLSNRNRDIYLYGSNENEIHGNIISVTQTGLGIALGMFSSYNMIKGNYIYKCNSGISVSSGEFNEIFNNDVFANRFYGIRLGGCTETRIYNNNLIDNENNGFDDTNNENHWNESYPICGNYWDDYLGDDDNGDGIGDISYEIDSDSHDELPLMELIKREDSPPIIELISPMNESIIKPGTLIDLSISDEHLREVHFKLNDNPEQLLTYPYDIDTVNWDEGDNLLKIESRDFYDNNNTKVFRFIIDSLPPYILLNSPSNNSIMRSGIEINLSISDPNLSKVRYSFNNDSMLLFYPPYIFDTSSWNEGNYIVLVNASDHASNFKLKWYNFTIDNTPPDIMLNSPYNNSIKRAGFRLEFTVSDSNLYDVKYSINNGPQLDFTYPYELETKLWDDGLYRINIYANDIASNDNLYWIEFIIDSTSPEIALLSPENISFIGVDVIIDLTVSDTNLHQVMYSRNDSGKDSLSSPFNIMTEEWSDGNHTIDVYASDFADNNISRSYFFIKDTINPEVTLISPSNGSIIKDASSIDFEIYDINLDKATFSINQGSYLEFGESYDFDISDWSEGEYVITINAQDKAGLKTEQWFNFFINNVSPFIESTSIDDNSVNIDVESQIVYEFSESMDIQSVEDAISIYPNVDYSCSWSSDNKTLTIICDQSLDYETLYKISISTKAKDLADRGLEDKFELEFTTEAKPKDKDIEVEDFPVLYLLLTLLVVAIIVVLILVMVMSKKKKAPVSGVDSELLTGVAQTPQTIQITCSNCHNLLQVNDTGMTQNVTCTYCSTLLSVPSQMTAASNTQPQVQAPVQPQSQIQPQTQAQQPTQSISCPKCQYKFSVAKTGSPMQIQCPNCGVQGTLR